MISKYGLICEVAKSGSFSLVAEKYGYAQSTISQAIKTLEDELGVQLIDRKRNGITWTSDGFEFEPYLRAIYTAELELEKKTKAVHGLEDAVIRIGTFTSVSRDILPKLMTEFKIKYPNVRFELHQGDYDNIADWLEDGTIDLGFISSEMTGKLDFDVLYRDEMMAVLPLNHPLTKYDEVSLEQLSEDTFILLDEGKYSTPLAAFSQKGLTPNIEYKIYDDYSILSMVKNRLGISILFKNVVAGYDKDVAIKKLKDPIERRICLAQRQSQTLHYSAKQFQKFTINRFKNAEK